MPSAGELLRSERLKRNRTLSDIANHTCISTRYLEAIEAENTEILPGDFFHRSFIRQYASALGLSDEETKQILDTVVPTPEVDLLPLSLPQHIAEMEQSSKPLARFPASVAATLLVIVLAGCSGLFALWNRTQESQDNQPLAAQEEPGPAPAAQIAPKTAAAPEAAGAPAGETARSRTETAQPLADGEQKIKVDLAATEKTWVTLSSSGRTVFSGIIDPSQTKNFAIEENARLLTGNAAGLDIRMNGRSLGPIGARGQVRVVLFSQNNYRILSPSKM